LVHRFYAIEQGIYTHKEVATSLLNHGIHIVEQDPTTKEFPCNNRVDDPLGPQNKTTNLITVANLKQTPEAGLDYGVGGCRSCNSDLEGKEKESFLRSTATTTTTRLNLLLVRATQYW